MNSEKVIYDIINCWDPMDLIGYSPKDEYQLEIKAILEYCNVASPNINDLAKKIYEIFTSSFGVSNFFKSSECIFVSEQIINSRDKGTEISS